MGQNRTADREVRKLSTTMKIKSPDRLRNLCTDLQIRSTLAFRLNSGRCLLQKTSPQYDVPELKTLALNCIRGGLAICNIVEDTFCRFVSQYEEVRNLYVEQLAYVWVESTTRATPIGIGDKIESFVGGDLGHAAGVVSELWDVLNKDEDITVPSDTPLPVTQVKSPVHWKTVNTALLNSIRTGVFFDRKYWARHFSTGEAFKPIYFSSLIINDLRSELSSVVKYLIGPSTLVDYIKGDCGDDLEEPGEGTWDVQEGVEEQVRAVLIVGSFSSWKSLFFYRCTDGILFAPLKEHGVEIRQIYVDENTMAAAPPPCSPKSIYFLATLLEMNTLFQAASGVLLVKHREVHSSASHIQQAIAVMKNEHFIPSRKDPKFIGLMKRDIERTSNGSSSNLGGLLKFGFKKAVELKKQGRGTLLRCQSANCPRSTHPFSRSLLELEPNCGCPSCGYWYLSCASCGDFLGPGGSSCNTCGKKLI